MGWLIDSGRHRPDTGNYLFKPDLRPLGLLPNPVDPQPIQTSDENSELPLQKVRPSAAEQRCPYRTFTPGELPPPPGWWLELFHLCQKLHVPCDRKQPDLSTVSSIVDAVDQMIASARATITDSRSDVLTLTAITTSPLSALSDGHQQSATGSLTVGSVRQHREGTPFAGGGTVALNDYSTEHRVEDVSARLPVATTGTLAATLQTENTTPHAVVMPDENGPTQIGEGSSGSKNGDVTPPMSDPPASESERIGSWECCPTQVKDSGWLVLHDLPGAVFKLLLQTKNPDGWVTWESLGDGAWDQGPGPEGRNLVIAVVYRLNTISHDYAKDRGSKRLVHSRGRLDRLSYRIDPTLK